MYLYTQFLANLLFLLLLHKYEGFCSSSLTWRSSIKFKHLSISSQSSGWKASASLAVLFVLSSLTAKQKGFSALRSAQRTKFRCQVLSGKKMRLGDASENCRLWSQTFPYHSNPALDYLKVVKGGVLGGKGPFEKIRSKTHWSRSVVPFPAFDLFSASSLKRVYFPLCLCCPIFSPV